MLEHVGIFADGVAVRQVGALTFELCRRYLDGTLTVSTDEICAAIQDVFEETRTVLEPSGAVALAGLKRAAETGTLAPGAAVAIASGANMNFTRLGYVTERAEIGEHREAILAVTIPERPGAFLEFCRTIGERSVTEFNYRLATRSEAHVFVGVEVTGRPEAAAIAETLRAHGYAVRRSRRRRPREDPRPPHGRRPEPGGAGRGALQLRVPRAARARCCSS